MVSRSRVRPVRHFDRPRPVDRRPVVLADPPSRQAGIDRAACVCGMSTGFGVLVTGALLQPIANAVPALGANFLLVTAIVGFAIAGSRIGNARRPGPHGAAAAVGSYLLILPLVLASSAGIDPSQIGATGGVAVAVGATAGFCRAWLRGRTATANAGNEA